MNKLEKIEHIKKVCQEEEISAYKIAQETGLSSVGIQKILNSETKNPNNSTLVIIIDFLEKAVLGKDIGKVKEPEIVYNKQQPDQDLKKLVHCLEKQSELRNEIQRLQRILRKNKIEFDDNFEE